MAKSRSPNRSPSLLVIDSGVGGLSICQALREEMPALDLIYVADDAYFPYGLMTEEALTERLIAIMRAMLSQHQPDMVVLACNTVSTLVLPVLRKNFDVPFVGVVPAIKPAAVASESRRIGLLATPATVTRPYIDDLIQDFAGACEVTRVGSNELVLLAEDKLSGKLPDIKAVRAILEPFVIADIDTLVLGCTHFPLLREEIQQALPDVSLIDSGSAIARRVKSLLTGGAVSDRDSSHYLRMYFSHTIPETGSFTQGLATLGIEGVEFDKMRI